MKQLDSEEAKSENNSNFLGKKSVHFKVEKDLESIKKPLTQKYTEKNLNEGRWSYEEQKEFIKALSKYGPNWKKIKQYINFRTLTQIRSHAQKFFKRLKECKNNQIGIDFTRDSIRSIKDMINHIKSVNINYDVNKVFLYFFGIGHKNNDLINENDFFNKNKINISNINTQTTNKDNNKIDLINLNNLNNNMLLDSLNTTNNNLNAFILNILNKSIITNNLINHIFNSYLEDINRALSKAAQSPILNVL